MIMNYVVLRFQCISKTYLTQLAFGSVLATMRSAMLIAFVPFLIVPYYTAFPRSVGYSCLSSIDYVGRHVGMMLSGAGPILFVSSPGYRNMAIAYQLK